MSFVTIQVTGGPDLTPVSMPAATTSIYAAKRAAEALGLDPETRDWFLYDPVAGKPIAEEEIMVGYDGRVLKLAWTEEEG